MFRTSMNSTAAGVLAPEIVARGGGGRQNDPNGLSPTWPPHTYGRKADSPANRCRLRSHLGSGQRDMANSHDDFNQPETLLTPSEVAALFRVNPKTVTRWARSGKLTAIRTLGGHRRFKSSEIRRWLEEMSHEPL